VLSALNLNQDQFIDLCILCGCDYTNTIGGVGPVKAYKFIQDHSTIERTLKHIEKEIAHQQTGKKSKFIIPDEFNYEDSRTIFRSNEYPELLPEISEQLKWNKPDETELKEFLVTQKGFNPEKVDNGMKKLAKSIPQLGRTQVRLDNFFKSSGAPAPSAIKKAGAHATANGFKKKK